MPLYENSAALKQQAPNARLAADFARVFSPGSAPRTLCRLCLSDTNGERHCLNCKSLYTAQQLADADAEIARLLAQYASDAEAA